MGHLADGLGFAGGCSGMLGKKVSRVLGRLGCVGRGMYVIVLRVKCASW